jgi:gliding motility associated protien GldN
MKPIYFISLLFVLFTFSQQGFAQNQQPEKAVKQAPNPPGTPKQTPPQTPVQQKQAAPQTPPQTPPRPNRARAANTEEDNKPGLTERAKIKNEILSKVPSHVTWLREIYRDIDLEKENNTPLYFPTQAIGDRANLFTLIFRLLADGKLTVYKYKEAGNEVYTDNEKENFEDVLKRYEIAYTTQGGKFIVNEGDIPSAEVLNYTIKEAWFFDEATGTYNSQVVSLCPIMKKVDYDIGDTTKNALFWLPYENIRPYISREMIMTSNFNNALTYTIDDYFSKKMYAGEIVKTVNLKNESLRAQVGDNPEALKLAQDSLENQLKFFESQLWIPEDTTTTAAVADKKAKKESDSKDTKSRGTAKVKEEKPKSGPDKSATTPTKSVRRRK